MNIPDSECKITDGEKYNTKLTYYLTKINILLSAKSAKLRNFPFIFQKTIETKVNRSKKILTIKPNKHLSTKTNKTFYTQTKDGFKQDVWSFHNKSPYFHQPIRFKPGDFCINQLLSITNGIYAPFDEGFEIWGTFLDIWKAFDKVLHEGLIFNLE